MSEEKIPYGEIICEAVDTIVSKRMEGLEYDVTKTCIVTDDTYKSVGKYTVSDNSVKFEAYSTITTLSIGDSVLVNIPKGDYNNQKTILNKVIISSEDTTYLTYTSPLENMLRFTDNILTTTSKGILANGETTAVLIDTIKNWSAYAEYTTMGISAKFETLFSAYNVVSGNYGLMFKFINKAQSETIYYLTLDDMNGNPYYFNTAIEQQKLIDISNLKNIESLEVYLYQNQDFKNDSGDKIPYEIEGDEIAGVASVPFANNILVSDLSIIMGYDIGSFNGDNLTLGLDSSVEGTTGYKVAYGYSNSESSALKRRIKLHWIHQIDDTTYKVVDSSSDTVEIIWLHYKIGGQCSSITMANLIGSYDEISVNWVDEETTTILTHDVTLDTNQATEQYRALCRIKENGIWSDYYISETITFSNLKYTVDTTTYEAIKGLNLKCIDGSSGNYYLYGTNSELINEGIGQGYNRTIQVQYNGLALTNTNCALHGQIQDIIWTIPKVNTMITYNQDAFGNGTVLPNSENNAYNDWRGTNLETSEVEQFDCIDYSIKNILVQSARNNNITCKITTTSGMTYTTSTTLNFGVSGTSGSNYTLVLAFENNLGAIPCTATGTLLTPLEGTVKALLYDSNGTSISYSKPHLTWALGDKTKTDTDTLNILDILGTGAQIDATSNYRVLTANYKKDSIDVTAYLPLGFYVPNPAETVNISHMDGARKVIYNSQGIPNYYSGAYAIYSVGKNGDEEAKLGLRWKFNSLSDLLSLKEESSDFYLCAQNVYQKESTPYACIYALYGDNCIWSQAIYVIQSAYDYAITNSWDNTLTLNDENGTVMASMLGAGIKDDQNRFSGVLIGEVEANGITNIGLYGIKEGSVAYSLTGEGKAEFKGNSNTTIISLGGSNSTITSSNMNLNVDEGTMALGSSLKFTPSAITASDSLTIGQDGSIRINNTTVNADGSIVAGNTNIGADGTVVVGNTTISASGKISYLGTDLDTYISNIAKKLIDQNES